MEKPQLLGEKLILCYLSCYLREFVMFPFVNTVTLNISNILLQHT